jgi:hypothetical protein
MVRRANNLPLSTKPRCTDLRAQKPWSASLALFTKPASDAPERSLRPVYGGNRVDATKSSLSTVIIMPLVS